MNAASIDSGLDRPAPAYPLFERSRFFAPKWVTPQLAAFGGFLAVMAIILALTGHILWAAYFTLMTSVLFFLTQYRFQAKTHFALSVECISYPLVMGAAFSAMGTTVPMIHPATFQQALLNWDRLLFGDRIELIRQMVFSHTLTQLLSFCYLGFFGILVWSLVRYVVWNHRLLEPYYRGLFCLYGVSFVGYLLVPAAGPYYDFPSLSQSSGDIGLIASWCSNLVLDQSNHVDAFPSVHCAVSAYFLGFLWTHHRREFWFWLLPIVGLWCSTIYLQFHYAVDCVAGFTLAFAALRIARIRRPESCADRQPQGSSVSSGALDGISWISGRGAELK